MTEFRTPHFIIALLIIALFAWAFGENVNDDTMKGALIGAFNLAIGFYLGSVVGNRETVRNTGAAFRAIEATAKASGNAPPEPDVTLKPGETAQAEERP